MLALLEAHFPVQTKGHGHILDRNHGQHTNKMRKISRTCHVLSIAGHYLGQTVRQGTQAQIQRATRDPIQTGHLIGLLVHLNSTLHSFLFLPLDNQLSSIRGESHGARVASQNMGIVWVVVLGRVIQSNAYPPHHRPHPDQYQLHTNRVNRKSMRYVLHRRLLESQRAPKRWMDEGATLKRKLPGHCATAVVSSGEPP